MKLMLPVQAQLLQRLEAWLHSDGERPCHLFPAGLQLREVRAACAERAELYEARKDGLSIFNCASCTSTICAVCKTYT